MRRGDDDRLGLGPGAQLRDVGPVRSAERQPGRVHRRADRRPQFRLAGLQAADLERSDGGPVADREAFRDEDRPAHPAAERAAHRDVEGSQDRPGHALPDFDRPGLADLPGDKGSALGGGPDLQHAS